MARVNSLLVCLMRGLTEAQAHALAVLIWGAVS